MMSNVEEVYPESMEQYNNNSCSEETDYCDEEEDDETLSFSDLPIYGGSSSSEDDFRNSDRYQEQEEDSFFEFSSDDFTASAYPAKNIMFCGKIIPLKYPSESSEFPCDPTAAEEEEEEDRSFSRCGETYGDLYSCSRSLMLSEPEKYKSRRRMSPNKQVSVLTTSPSKSKWMLFMFGFAKLPYAEMELSDMKSRQRHRTSGCVASPSKEIRKSSNRKGKGCWEMIKVGLGCSSIHANAVIDASFACMPRE